MTQPWPLPQPLLSSPHPPTRQLAEVRYDPLAFISWFEDFPRAGTRGEKLPRQVRYLARYLNALPAHWILIESHYVDRDYIEDYGEFYAKSFVEYRNVCHRLHFFSDSLPTSTSPLQQMRGLRAIIAAKPSGTSRENEYKDSCEVLSHRYLGFMVVKPLPKCPIGRTVLQPIEHYVESSASDPFARLKARRKYEAHVGGFRLHVEGVAFEQQDKGTSACATTAIWMALHKLGDRTPGVSPAAITRLATRYSIPNGRSLPSESLTVAQMCEAIRGVELAPYLFRCDNAEMTREILHLAVMSDMPVIAIGRSAQDRLSPLHAVTVLGGKLKSRAQSTELVSSRASDLVELYLHDDRIGPYVTAQIVADDGDLRDELARQLGSSGGVSNDDFVIRIHDETDGTTDHLVITQLLFPLHPKIRVSLTSLVEWSIAIAADARATFGTEDRIDLWYSMRLLLGTEYVYSLMAQSALGESQLAEICERLALSRYVAVIRVGLTDRPLTDVVFDTTGTDLHAPVLAVIALSDMQESEVVTIEVAYGQGIEQPLLYGMDETRETTMAWKPDAESHQELPVGDVKLRGAVDSNVQRHALDLEYGSSRRRIDWSVLLLVLGVVLVILGVTVDVTPVVVKAGPFSIDVVSTSAGLFLVLVGAILFWRSRPRADLDIQPPP